LKSLAAISNSTADWDLKEDPAVEIVQSTSEASPWFVQMFETIFRNQAARQPSCMARERIITDTEIFIADYLLT
jgi:hypothetical protein